MTHLIIVILALLLAISYSYVGMNYTGNKIVNSESEMVKNSFENVLNLNEMYTENNNNPLPITNWKSELNQYGRFLELPPQMDISYDYSDSENKYYFCIFRNTGDLKSHQAVSQLRYGFPRKDDGSGNMVLSTNRGYDLTYFNVNEDCGDSTNYYEDGITEPTEDGGDVTRPIAATFWIGDYEKYYIEKSQDIAQDFTNFKNAFDEYVAANGTPPSESLTIDQVFNDLRPYGKLPQNYNNFEWSYGLNNGSNYLCLSTIDTSSVSEIQREIHAESIYQIENIFDNSYFKINRTSCTSASQSRTTDYSTAVSVYGSYLLN